MRGHRGAREGLVLGSEGSLRHHRTFVTNQVEVSAEIEKVLSLDLKVSRAPSDVRDQSGRGQRGDREGLVLGSEGLSGTIGRS